LAEEFRNITMVGQTITWGELPKQIRDCFDGQLQKSIFRVYKNWCDVKQDQYYIQLKPVWLFINDFNRFAKYKQARIGDGFYFDCKNTFVFIVQK